MSGPISVSVFSVMPSLASKASMIATTTVRRKAGHWRRWHHWLIASSTRRRPSSPDWMNTENGGRRPGWKFWMRFGPGLAAPMSAIGVKADMPFCTAYVRF